jgi:hypothetical protein
LKLKCNNKAWRLNYGNKCQSLEFEQQFEAHVTIVKLQIQNAKRNLKFKMQEQKKALNLMKWIHQQKVSRWQHIRPQIVNKATIEKRDWLTMIESFTKTKKLHLLHKPLNPKPI